MDFSEAKSLMDGCFDVNAALNDALFIAESIEDEVVKRKMKKAIGLVGAKIYLNCMRSIVRQYPQLDPDAGAEDGREA